MHFFFSHATEEQGFFFWGGRGVPEKWLSRNPKKGNLEKKKAKRVFCDVFAIFQCMVWLIILEAHKREVWHASCAKGVAALTKSYNLISIYGKKKIFFYRCICHHVFILGHLLILARTGLFRLFCAWRGGAGGPAFWLVIVSYESTQQKAEGRLFDMAVDVELKSAEVTALLHRRRNAEAPPSLGGGEIKIILGFFFLFFLCATTYSVLPYYILCIIWPPRPLDIHLPIGTKVMITMLQTKKNTT